MNHGDATGVGPKRNLGFGNGNCIFFHPAFEKNPGLKSNLIISAFALVGFSSVLMKFFGVNYYLSGMHLYVQGDPSLVPVSVYWAILIITIIIILAFLSERKYANNKLISELEQLDN